MMVDQHLAMVRIPAHGLRQEKLIALAENYLVMVNAGTLPKVPGGQEPHLQTTYAQVGGTEKEAGQQHP